MFRQLVRNFSLTAAHWKDSQKISIPRERLKIQFAHSSGAGGQNVNKVSTKVDMRFVLAEADWIPEEVKHRLVLLRSNQVNTAGEFVVVSQKTRSQVRD